MMIVGLIGQAIEYGIDKADGIFEFFPQSISAIIQHSIYLYLITKQTYLGRPGLRIVVGVTHRAAFYDTAPARRHTFFDNRAARVDKKIDDAVSFRRARKAAVSDA